MSVLDLKGMIASNSVTRPEKSGLMKLSKHCRLYSPNGRRASGLMVTDGNGVLYASKRARNHGTTARTAALI